jgi:hypothetical protein
MFVLQITNVKFILKAEKRLALIFLGIILSMMTAACTTNGNSLLSEPTLTTATPLEAPQHTPPTFEPELDRIKGLALTSLATQLNINEILLKPIDIELVNWSNASLGCPKPGYLYAQVVTAGYRITFDLNGILYKIHSNLDGTHMVKC